MSIPRAWKYITRYQEIHYRMSPIHLRMHQRLKAPSVSEPNSPSHTCQAACLSLPEVCLFQILFIRHIYQATCFSLPVLTLSFKNSYTTNLDTLYHTHQAISPCLEFVFYKYCYPQLCACLSLPVAFFKYTLFQLPLCPCLKFR